MTAICVRSLVEKNAQHGGGQSWGGASGKRSRPSKMEQTLRDTSHSVVAGIRSRVIGEGVFYFILFENAYLFVLEGRD